MEKSLPPRTTFPAHFISCGRAASLLGLVKTIPSSLGLGALFSLCVISNASAATTNASVIGALTGNTDGLSTDLTVNYRLVSSTGFEKSGSKWTLLGSSNKVFLGGNHFLTTIDSGETIFVPVGATFGLALLESASEASFHSRYSIPGLELLGSEIRDEVTLRILDAPSTNRNRAVRATLNR